MADPLRNFRFRVEIDGITDAGFTEASGFGTTSDVIEYREGRDPSHVRKLPGLTKSADVVLKFGLTDDKRLFDWRQEIIDGKTTRKTVYVIAVDEIGTEKVRWQCDNAWPSKIEPVAFNAKGNDVGINSLTITCEEIKRTK
jgi:phage tail-like protein